MINLVIGSKLFHLINRATLLKNSELNPEEGTLNLLKSYTGGNLMGAKTMRPMTTNPSTHRSTMSATRGNTFASPQMNIQPKLLESKVSSHKDFFRLSDGFKKIFATDKGDAGLVIPVVGYGGHFRGDRSQNYFGKNFRETCIKAKNLERQLRTPPSQPRVV